MNVELVPTDSLVLDPENVRQHPQRSLDAITSSLTQFGQQKPIVVDQAGVVRAGNGTLLAARSLGWTEIAVVRSGLTPGDLEAYSLADNRSAELARWDYEGLSDALLRMQDSDPGRAAALGWSEAELVNLLATDWTPPSSPDADLGELQVASGDSSGDAAQAISVSFSATEVSLIEAVGRLLSPEEALPHSVVLMLLVKAKLAE
jgi:ParB-like chromosome segregation protein Spo0J